MAWDERGRIHASLTGKRLVGAVVKDDSLLLIAADGTTVQVRWDDEFGPFFENGLLVPHSYDRDPALERHLCERTIAAVVTDGNFLFVRFPGGEEVKVGWDAATGRPKFCGQNVAIPIQLPPIFGAI